MRVNDENKVVTLAVAPHEEEEVDQPIENTEDNLSEEIPEDTSADDTQE